MKNPVRKKQEDIEFQKAFPQSAKKLDFEEHLKRKFADTQFQRGLSWRKSKLEAIHEARKNGKSENWILISLMRGGVTESTALKMMNDSKLVFEEGGDTE